MAPIHEEAAVLMAFDIVALDADSTGLLRRRGPHGLKTVTSLRNGWYWIAVEGDIGPVDIPSLATAACDAFLRRPPHLVVDLTGVAECDVAGIRWLRAVHARITSCGGEFRVVAVASGEIDRLLRRSGIEVFTEGQISALPESQSLTDL